MKRREALGVLVGACSLAGCSGEETRTTTEETTTPELDMPPREMLTGWPTYRASPGRVGVAADASVPNGGSFDRRWRTELQASEHPRLSVAGRVALLARGRQGVAALDLESGEQRAADLAAGDAVTTEVSVHDGTVHFGTHAGEVVAVDAVTGEREWAVGTNRFTDEADREVSLPIPESTPTVSDGRVYAGGPIAGEKPDGTALFCIEDGETLWRFETNHDSVGSPVVVGGRAYARFGSAVVAIDATDGEERWRASAETDSPEDGPHTVRGPAVADGGVFFSGPDGRAFAHDAATGERRWTFDTDGPTALNSSVVRPAYSPAATGGTVFVGASDGRLYALDAESGDPVWTFEPDERVVYWTAPAVAGETVYVGANPPRRDSDGTLLDAAREQGFVFAVDAETGSLRARYEAAGLATAPAVGDEIVVAGFVTRDRNATIVALE